MAQVNPTVGDLAGNAKLVIGRAKEAAAAGAELVAFPELVLSGYPPEDLLLKDHFLIGCRRELEAVATACPDIVAVVGVPLLDGSSVYNAAAILADGAIKGVYRKIWLPNYAVFDEKRYFAAGSEVLVLQLPDARIGINICEDIWEECGPTEAAGLAGGAEIVVNLSMSPYHVGKGVERQAMLAARAADAAAFVCYGNGGGGQDELVFDGQSLVLSPVGEILARGRQFEEQLLVLDLDPAVARGLKGKECRNNSVPLRVVDLRGVSGSTDRVPARKGENSVGPEKSSESGANIPVGRVGRLFSPPLPSLVTTDLVTIPLSEEAEVYEALRLGVHDYVTKNRFGHVVIGLSGGIDSALTACIAVDALGAGCVTGVSMPSRFSSAGTRSDARELAELLGVEFHEIPIEHLFEVYLESLAPYLAGRPLDVTEQNIQARIRCNILMALSNKFGWLVLTTGNKSEIAVGYTTLYGDMAGGFAVIKDVPKTLVYRLSTYRNSLEDGPGPVPASTLERAPSAELTADQTDQDTLPPYEILDRIIDAYVVRDESVDEIAALGVPLAEVERVVAMIDGNEYKRRQAAPGVRITPKAFGKDRRLPITNRFRG